MNGNQESCKRELTIEVPAEAVRAEAEKVTAGYQRQARVPGFRPGKTPLSVVRQRFRDDIRGEVLRHLAADYFRRRVREENLDVIGSPEFSDVHLDLDSNDPLRFKAVFEVVPAFELKDYIGLEVEVEEPGVSGEEVEEALKRLQQQHATFIAVDDRRLEEGDFALISFEGRPVPAPQGGQAEAAEAAVAAKRPVGGTPVKVNDVLCEIGGADTLPAFTENLRGASPGEGRTFPVTYPEEFSDRRLAGRTFLYEVRISAIKQKQVPELNDEFARDLGPFQSLEEVRDRIREDLLEEKRRRAEQEAKDKLVDKLVDLHDFPVPESLVEKQVQTRLERSVRQLAARGVDPSRLKVDWSGLRASHREPAVRDVRAGLILDRIAQREGIEVSEEEAQGEVERLARQAPGKDAAAVRARLTRQGVADSIKDRLRSEKTLSFLYHKANRILSRAGVEGRR